ncbi:hypothetical protein JCM1840_004270 [Sporobolomyces johnsonii]
MHRSKPLPPPVSSSSSSSGALPVSPSPNSSRQLHSKLGLKILLDRPIYVAGASLVGELEVAVKGKELALGEIAIELNAKEELRNRDHTSTRRLLNQNLTFQGPCLPPSAAIVPGSSPLKGSYYPALHGRTRFPFSFPLPKTLPSTCAFGANAITRYELHASAMVMFDGEVDIRSENKEVVVVERWEDWRKGNWTQGVEKAAQQELKGREAGVVKMHASIGKDPWSGTLPRLFWWRDVDQGIEGKGSVEVRVRLKNATKRHVTGLSLSLVRRMRHVYPKDQRPISPPPIINKTITTEHFRGLEYDVRSGAEREVALQLQLPKDECWTERKGTLFELDCFVKVEVECGFFEKNLFVELPIYVAHPFSISKAAHRHAAEERERFTQQPELPEHVPFPRSPTSTMSFAAPPLHAPPVDPYAPSDFGSRYLPPPGGGYHYASSTVSVSPSMSSPAMQHYSSPSPQPYFPPPPAPPPVEAYQQQLPPPPPASNGYIAFDPNVPDLTPSRFLGSLQHQQPAQVYVASESHTNVPIGPPAPSSVSLYPAPPPPPPSLTPQSVSPNIQYQQRDVSPQRPISAYGHRSSPSFNAGDLGRSLSPQEQHQVEANVAPVEPYSGMARAHQDPRTASPLSVYAPPHDVAQMPRQHTAPLPSPSWNGHSLNASPHFTPPPACPSPAPTQVRASTLPPAPSSFSSRAPLRTPPPPAPSSHFRQHSPSPSIASLPLTSHSANHVQPDAGLLDTIGEDGESQAGTAKSVALTASALEALKLGKDIEDAEIHSVRVGNSPGRSSVQDLEELVAEEERKAELDRQEGGNVVDMEKTIPKPPAPSEKVASSTSTKTTILQDIFRPTDSDVARAPSPSKSPSRPAAKMPPRSKGGLAALEARLSRSTTPTQPTQPVLSPIRSPSPSKPSPSPSPAPRTLDLPNPGSSALRARSISRASRQREEEQLRALKEAEEDPAEAVRKALAKASWMKKEKEKAEVSEETRAIAARVEAEMRREQEEKEQASKAKASKNEPEEEAEEEPQPKSLPPARYEPLHTAPTPPLGPNEPTPLSPPSRPSSRPVFSSAASKRQTLPALPSRSADPSPVNSPASPTPRPLPSRPTSLATGQDFSPPAAVESAASPIQPTEQPFSLPTHSEPLKSPSRPASPSVNADPPKSPARSVEQPFSPPLALVHPESPLQPASTPAIAGAPTSPLPLTSSPSSQSLAKITSEGRKVVDAVELKGLKQDAVARISTWLTTGEATEEPSRPAPAISPWSLQKKDSTASDASRKRRTIEFGRLAPAPPGSVSSASLSGTASSKATSLTSLSSGSTSSRAKRAAQEPTVAQLLAAETRAALRGAESARPPSPEQPSSVVKGLDGFLAAVNQAEEVTSKYAVSSARGGKGGKVTNVASIWASREEEAARERIKTPPPSLGHKSTKSLTSATFPSPSSPSVPFSPVGNSPARLNRRSLQTSPSPSLSPAAPAKPFLNTTLGRPSAPISPSATHAASPSFSRSAPSESASGPVAKVESFAASGPAGGGGGGGKVKELLARYQQQMA